MSRAVCVKCGKPIRYVNKTRYRGVAYNPDGSSHICIADTLADGLKPARKEQAR